MNNKTKSILGFATLAGLGALLGIATLKGANPRRLVPRRRRIADRDSVEDLVEKFAKTLPPDEAEAMLRRNREQLKDW